MPEIQKLIPNAEDLLALEPEELAIVLLQYLNSGAGRAYYEQEQPLKRGNFFLEGTSPAKSYEPKYRKQINEALAGA
jgi:hypothetical protein